MPLILALFCANGDCEKRFMGDCEIHEESLSSIEDEARTIRGDAQEAGWIRFKGEDYCSQYCIDYMKAYQKSEIDCDSANDIANLQASFYEFTKEFLGSIAPDTKFIDGSYVRAICDYIQRTRQ